MSTLKYGLIGAGNNAVKKHVKGYMNLPNVEFVAICDVNMEQAKQVAEQNKVPHVYSDYREMLKHEKLDIVSVCTPNFLHAEISIAALEAGVNVHCEKPLAVNGEEARRIEQARRRSGKQLMIGLNNRFTNAAVLMKKYMDVGMLGEIYQAKAGWIRRSGIPGRGTWFTNRKLSGGGVMIDLGVHYLDLVLYLMGMPAPAFITGAVRQTYANTTNRNRNGYKGNPNGIFDVEDSAVGMLCLENQATVSFEFSWASNIEEDKFYYELIGTKGGASFVNGELKLFVDQFDTCVDIHPKLNPNIKALDEFGHFAECVLTGKKPLAPAVDGVYVMDIIDGFYKAAAMRAPYSFHDNKVGV